MTRIRARLKQAIAFGPVARAVARAQWSATGVDAQIQVLMGSDARTLCNKAGRMFFVILGAAIAEGFDADDLDLRIVRGAVNAVYDIANLTEVPEASRAPINSGLEAVKRLASRMTTRSLADACFDLEAKLARGDVHMSEFTELLPEKRS